MTEQPLGPFIHDGTDYIQVDGKHEHSSFGMTGSAAHKHPHAHTLKTWNDKGHSCANIRGHAHHKNTYDAVNMIVTPQHRARKPKPVLPRERVFIAGWVARIAEQEDGAFLITIRRPGSQPSTGDPSDDIVGIAGSLEPTDDIDSRPMGHTEGT